MDRIEIFFRFFISWKEILRYLIIQFFGVYICTGTVTYVRTVLGTTRLIHNLKSCKVGNVLDRDRSDPELFAGYGSGIIILQYPDPELLI